METSNNPVEVPTTGLPGADAAWLPPRIAECVERVLIPADVIAERIRVLCEEITSHYAREGTDKLTALVVLKGAFMFAADLGRHLVSQGNLEIGTEFISVTTYGSDIKDLEETERDVQVDDTPRNLCGHHVLLIEDIVDQGFTIARIQRILEDEGALSVRICSLLVKDLDHSSAEVQALRDSLVIDFAGFRIPDQWVVGYGTDAHGRFRLLPHVCTVDENLYRG